MATPPARVELATWTGSNFPWLSFEDRKNVMVVDARRDRMVLMMQRFSFKRSPVSVAPTKDGQKTQSMVVPIRANTSETLSGEQFSLAPASFGAPMA
jgi:hypothetical protein